MNTVSAHTHEDADSGIKATLHIDPVDHPVVGQEARFFFTFEDPDGKFELSRCDCQITLEKDGLEVETKPVATEESKFGSLGNSPLYTKIFVETGEYELHMHGGPKNGATFDEFDLHFDVPVAQAAHSGITQHSSIIGGQHLGHIIIFGGGLLAAIILLIYGYKEKRTKKVSI